VRILTKTVFIIFTLLAFFLINNAYAENVFSENYDKSDLVLVGKVLSIQPRPNAILYEIQIEQYYKNPQTARVIAVYGPPKEDDLHNSVFEVDDRLFLYLKQEYGIYRILDSSFKLQYNCDAGGLVPPHSETYSHGMPASDDYPTFSDADFNGNIYKIGNKMQIKYIIHNYTPLIKHVTVTLLVNGTNQNKTVFSEQQTVIVPACNGSVPVEWSFTPQRADDYVVQAKVTSGYDTQRYMVILDEPYVTNSFQVRENVVGGSIDVMKIPSPLKQFKSGIPSQQVSCKYGFDLLLKASNGHPICVTPATKSKLLHTGWAESAIILEEGWVDRSK
jgi:hypothetical protein